MLKAYPKTIIRTIIVSSLCIHLLLGFSFIKASAPTYDEPVHLASGYDDLVSGKYRMDIYKHPPLAKMIGAVPLLFQNPLAFQSHPLYKSDEERFANLFLYKNRIPAGWMLNPGRIFCLVLWTFLFMFFIAAWAYRMEGAAAAVFACVIFAFSPFFISNDSLVTTDSAPAAFFLAAVFFAYCGFYGRGKSAGADDKLLFTALSPVKCFLLSGLFTGLAVSSKFSMFILPLLIIAAACLENLRTGKFPWTRLAAAGFVFFAAGFAVLAFVYRFTQLNLYFDGLSALLRSMEGGRFTFAMGRHFDKGVWWYFPLALAVKTPVSVILFAVLGVILPKNKLKRGYLWLLLPVCAYFAAAVNSKVQIGYRHLSPLFPFLTIFAGIGAGIIYGSKTVFSGRLRLPVVLLCVWAAGSVLSVHPHYLCYFNELAGGAKNGRKVLTDSNLDWGQGLKALSAELKKRGNPPVYLSYFGTGSPSYYGIRFVPAGCVFNTPQAGKEDASGGEKVLFAVSATNLESTYYTDKHVFDWLKKHKPVFTAGYSIFVYDITSDPQALEKAGQFLARVNLPDDSAVLKRRAASIRSRAME